MSIRFYGTVWRREESIAFKRELAAKETIIKIKFQVLVKYFYLLEGES